jgi:molecular chaperone GrpE
MGEATNGETMHDDSRPTDASQESHEPRARFRRRDSGSGKAQPPPDAGSRQGAEAGSASSVVGSLGDIRLSNEQVALIETAVQERVGAEQAKTEDAVQRLARTQADFANYKRRNEQEREQQARYATLLLVSEMLPVLDNLDRALTTVPESVTGLPWTDGLLLVDRQLRATLEKQGLQPIVAVGQHFDPMHHEAIIHEESTEHADDEVIAELRRGYMLHDKVVRPTLVKVAKHIEPATSASEEN